MALPNSNLLVSGSGAVFIQNLAVQGNSIVATNQDGNVEFVPNGSGVIAFGNVGFNNGLISTTVTNLDLVLSPDGTGNTLIAPYATGSVGIGTNNPSEMLDLVGTFEQEDTMTRFLRKTIPTVGSPFESLNGYILLGKAATTSGTNMPASYVVGKIIFRRGNTAESNFVDVYNVMSSRGYDNETFSVNIEHAGTSTTRFSRLVKCTYESVEYHAIETTDAGGANTHEQTFEGYSVDGGLLFVDETYVVGVVDYGNLGVVSNGDSNVGIGTVSTTAHFDVGTNDDGRIQAILTRGNDADFQLQAINSSSSNASGAIVSKFGVRHGADETALLNFIRGNLGNDGSLAIVTNNAERVRVDSAGNVGIGTSPTHKVEIVASNGQDALHVRGDSGSTNTQAVFLDSTNGIFLRTANTSSTYFALEIQNSTNNSMLHVRNDGNVGIGTTSPTSRLTINSGSTVHHQGEIAYHGLAITTGTDDQTMWLGYDGSVDVGYINCAKYGSQRHLCLQTRGFGVGIGTTSPAQTLDVNGTITHKGLVLNEGIAPNVDEIKTFTKTLSVSTSWVDTGIVGTNLTDGSYIVQVYDNINTGIGHYNMLFTGFMSWYSSNVTNDTAYNEILLHNAGHALNSNPIYLRTMMQSSPGYLKLQIRCATGSGSGDFVFKFRRMI